MKRLNILFSTTRQWNCGDEFILFGTRRLLDGVGINYNAIIYNRHPSISPSPHTLRKRWSRSEPLPNLDNSFFLDEPGVIDYVVFAGSPEWFGGPRVDPLLRFIVDNKIRCAFLGVGVHRPRQLSELLQTVLREHCDLITARDPVCYELVKDYPHAFYEVCPALFAAPKARQRTSIKSVGVVIQAGNTKHHSVPGRVLEGCLNQFAKLERVFPTSYIAHYIDDLKMGRALGKDVLYSGYSEDYAALFDRFDVILSTRVHGCGIASSLGIPNALIPHDGRYLTAQKFKSHIAGPGSDLLDWVKGIDVERLSSELIEYRSLCEHAYRELLTGHLSFLRSSS
jgi:hypothetical protein